MVVGAGPSSEQSSPQSNLDTSANNPGADIVRELGMLCVKRSSLAPRRVYRSLRTTPRYDTEQEKGWAEHINNVGPIQTFEPPSAHSNTGRIITVSGDSLDDVDVSQTHQSIHVL